MKLDTIRKSYFIYVAIMLLLGIFGVIALYKNWADFGQLIGGFLIILIAVLAVSFPMSLSWWRQIDEAARDAHKTAWFWGGSIGMTVAILISALNLFFDGAFLNWLGRVYFIKDVQKYGFEFGVIIVMACMGVGYMINWAMWWKGRGA